MSKIQTIPMTAADPEVAAGNAQFLTPVVLGLQALGVNGKQAHWNVRGNNFIAIHELLDSVVEHAQDYADLAAERIVALGLPVDARVSVVAERTQPTAIAAGFSPWKETVAAIVGDIDAVLVDVQTAIDELDAIDLTSQDVAISIKAGLEKDRWFLSAHLAE